MPIASEIYQEGLIIPPIKLWDAGKPNQAALALILRNVRTPTERRGDLAAQVAANRTAERRILELVHRSGLETIKAHIDALIAYAERITRATIEQIPDGVYEFTDHMDDDGIGDEPLAIKATVIVDGSNLTVDFSGTSAEVRGSVNAVASVARSATYYVVRCLMPDESPSNAGTFAPVSVITPEGTLVNARSPRPVAGGNVETSQRITDVVLGAMAKALPHVIPAASQGTMNNVTAGGIDHRTGQPFAYYETMGGGMGARPDLDGISGVHVHMSNTLNTPVEAFEFAYPMRITEYRLRDGSGGAGAMSGGDGLVREIRFEVPTEVTLLTERRRLQPYGLEGGEPGKQGENILIRGQSETSLGGKATISMQPGDRLSIRSPGGGGWGTPPDSA
jgi:N-methylhydantoinase B